MSKGLIIQSSWSKPEDVIINDSSCKKCIPDNDTLSFSDKVEEILSVYNESRLSSGVSIFTKQWEFPRNEIHRKGLLHTGAQIWVYTPKGDVLIQKRASTVLSSRGLLDASAAWHIPSGFTVRDGWVRELKQEIGLIVKPQDLSLIGNYRKETKKITESGYQHNNEIDQVFLVLYDGSLSDLKKQDSEVEKLIFIPIEQLEQDWNNPEILARYTSRSEMYRFMVISSIKQILWFTK